MESKQTSAGLPMGIKITIGVIVFTGLAVGGYFAYDYFKKPKAALEPEAKSPDSSSSSSSTSTVSTSSNSGGGGKGGDSFPLHKGSKGANVEKFQNAVNKYYTGFPDKQLTADGDFGGKSLTAAQNLFGKTKTEIAQGDIDWLNAHSFKVQKGTGVKKPATKEPSFLAQFGLA